MQYYLLQNGEQTGPFTMDQLKGLWQAGQITSLTPYWFEGLEGWLPLESMVEDTIREEKAEETKRQAIVTHAAKEAQKEKPIPVGESIAICLISLLATVITFVVGIIYCIAGKRNRGVLYMGWSLFWFVALVVIQRSINR